MCIPIVDSDIEHQLVARVGAVAAVAAAAVVVAAVTVVVKVPLALTQIMVGKMYPVALL